MRIHFKSPCNQLRAGSVEKVRTFERHREGFTLAEMITVMGIIILVVISAVPVIRNLMGSSSIGMARNNVAALLARAREDAIALQDYRGVVFFIDKNNDRVIGMIVQTAAVQDSNPNTRGTLLLDAVPGRDAMSLPSGVRLQTIFAGVEKPSPPPSTTPTVLVHPTPGTGDRYLGFNLLPGTATATVPGVLVGGVILFDGNGKLVSIPYGFQMSTTAGTASNLCQALRVPYAGILTYTSPPNVMGVNNFGQTPKSYEFIPGVTADPTSGAYICRSQIGLILFDYDAFKSLGFTDQDADINGQTYASAWMLSVGVDGDGIHSEKDEETWLDANSTPLMVNRFDGTLIRGE